MAKSPEAVQSFLTDLGTKLRELGDSELVTLTELKKASCAAAGLPSDDVTFKSWDFRHFAHKQMEAEYKASSHFSFSLYLFPRVLFIFVLFFWAAVCVLLCVCVGTG